MNVTDIHVNEFLSKQTLLLQEARRRWTSPCHSYYAAFHPPPQIYTSIYKNVRKKTRAGCGWEAEDILIPVVSLLLPISPLKKVIAPSSPGLANMEEDPASLRLFYCVTRDIADRVIRPICYEVAVLKSIISARKLRSRRVSPTSLSISIRRESQMLPQQPTLHSRSPTVSHSLIDRVLHFRQQLKSTSLSPLAIQKILLP